MSTYLSVLFAVKYFHIFILSVRLNLSTIDALVSLYVVKKRMPCFFKKVWNCILINSIPLSVWNIFGLRPFLIIFSKTLTRLFQVFAFIASTHACLLSTSITVKKYLYPLFCWLNESIMTKSASHSSCMAPTITRLRQSDISKVYVKCRYLAFVTIAVFYSVISDISLRFHGVINGIYASKTCGAFRIVIDLA